LFGGGDANARLLRKPLDDGRVGRVGQVGFGVI
jgi:hypothetical protein